MFLNSTIRQFSTYNFYHSLWATRYRNIDIKKKMGMIYIDRQGHCYYNILTNINLSAWKPIDVKDLKTYLPQIYYKRKQTLNCVNWLWLQSHTMYYKYMSSSLFMELYLIHVNCYPDINQSCRGIVTALHTMRIHVYITPHFRF